VTAAAGVRRPDLVAVAGELAEQVLFPASLSTDASVLLPAALLDALAAAGLYGLSTPASLGGADADPATVGAVVEVLASGCLTTTFVWLQHLSASATVARAEGPAHTDWAGALARGERRAGVAFAHLRRPDPPTLTARPDGDDWVLDGVAPWLTGWGRIDVAVVGARHGDEVVWLLVDPVGGPTLHADVLPLAALGASGTVTLRCDGHRVTGRRMAVTERLTDWQARDGLGLRTNGSLALGVTRRCVDLLGHPALGAELDLARVALDGATIDTVAEARAAACTLAVRAAAAVVAAAGGRGVGRDHHGQRLAREAMFLLVQGQTPAIRRHLLTGLTKGWPPPG